MGNATISHDAGHGEISELHADDQVNVVCDYLSADDPIERRFPATTELKHVKKWARETFVPNPPSDKAFYLSDDKTRHRFTDAEEHETLAKLGFHHHAHLRLHEEQVSGVDAV